jgi:hypothetical protein
MTRTCADPDFPAIRAPVYGAGSSFFSSSAPKRRAVPPPSDVTAEHARADRFQHARLELAHRRGSVVSGTFMPLMMTCGSGVWSPPAMRAHITASWNGVAVT